MNWSPRQLSPLLLLVCGWASLQAQPPSPQPTTASQDDVAKRRDSIHKELDENENTVKDLYQLLDATSKGEVAARRYLEAQIQQFDDRGTVLFEQLDVIDRHEFEQNRRHELTLQVQRLDEEAKQLRASGHVMPAAVRAAKAKSIRKSLSDGTWKLLVDQEWNCHDAPVKQEPLQLLIEVQKLKSETAALRQEVKALRELVTTLMTPKHLSKPN